MLFHEQRKMGMGPEIKKGEKTVSLGKVIDRVIREIEHLPTLPQVVMRVLAMAESRDVSALTLSKAMDQSLGAKVLKVANSAYYGGIFARTVTSIPHAIMIIGFDTVKEIILTTSFFHTFHDAQDVQELQPLWEHSMECALVAKRLAWVYRYEMLDEVYFSGLVHDLGKLIIQQYFADFHERIEDLVKKGVENLEAERKIMGVTHAEIGEKMGEHWSFPPTLVEAIAHHHDTSWKLNPKLGRILHLADRFVRESINFQGLLEAFAEAGMSCSATWDTSDIAAVEEILKEEIQKARSMFKFSKEIK